MLHVWLGYKARSSQFAFMGIVGLLHGVVLAPKGLPSYFSSSLVSGAYPGSHNSFLCLPKTLFMSCACSLLWSVPMARGHKHHGNFLFHGQVKCIGICRGFFYANTPRKLRQKLIWKRSRFIYNDTLSRMRMWTLTFIHGFQTQNIPNQRNKVSKIVDLYWHMKSLMGKVLVERNKAYNEIMLQLI
jgi:hypothetical protein